MVEEVGELELKDGLLEWKPWESEDDWKGARAALI